MALEGTGKLNLLGRTLASSIHSFIHQSEDLILELFD